MRHQAELGDVDFITGDYLAGTYVSHYLGSQHLGRNEKLDVSPCAFGES